MPRKILVPVDGSAHAGRAVDVASDIARAYGAQLTVLHAQEEAGGGRVPEELKHFAELEHVQVTERDIMRKVADDIVKDAVQRAHKSGLEAPQGAVEIGSPAKTIVDYAKRNDVDLIVMGRRGLSDLQGMLLGSVSHKVAQLADCNCLTVK